MTLEESVAVIISEASPNGDSLLASVRRGEDPGVERMRLLISALATAFLALKGYPQLDRNLAAALFTLGSDVPLTISSLASKGHAWRSRFMEDEIYELLMGVQSIFEDKGFEPEQPEVIH